MQFRVYPMRKRRPMPALARGLFTAGGRAGARIRKRLSSHSPTGIESTRKGIGMTTKNSFTYYEFFAGGGMARTGLGGRWRCLFANDNSVKKAAAYAANFKGDHFTCKNVEKVDLD